MKPCIYMISCSQGDKVYIGSAVNFTARKGVHLHQLRRTEHHSRHLQFAFNKHGEDAFSFRRVEAVDDVLFLAAREQMWMNRFAGRLYNMAPIAGTNLGVRHTKERKEKLRQRMLGNNWRRGQKMPDGYAENLAEKMRGNNFREGIPHSDEIKIQISQSLKRSYAEGRRGVKVPHAAGSAAITSAANIRKARFLELTALGRSTAEIMADIGISRDTVSHYRELRKKGLL